MKIDRTAEACGDCHVRGDNSVIDASGGFIKYHEQFEELIQTKHNSLSCVSCHDPHLGVIQGREDDIDTTRVDCESCHYEEAEIQASAMMKAAVSCTDCHMPRITKSAKGDAAQYSGDIMTHLFAIDPSADDQFTEDGSAAISQVTLDWACKSCHGSEGYANEYSDAVLLEEATDYHTG